MNKDSFDEYVKKYGDKIINGKDIAEFIKFELKKKVEEEKKKEKKEEKKESKEEKKEEKQEEKKEEKKDESRGPEAQNAESKEAKQTEIMDLYELQQLELLKKQREEEDKKPWTEQKLDQAMIQIWNEVSALTTSPRVKRGRFYNRVMTEIEPKIGLSKVDAWMRKHKIY